MDKGYSLELIFQKGVERLFKEANDKRYILFDPGNVLPSKLTSSEAPPLSFRQASERIESVQARARAALADTLRDLIGTNSSSHTELKVESVRAGLLHSPLPHRVRRHETPHSRR